MNGAVYCQSSTGWLYIPNKWHKYNHYDELYWLYNVSPVVIQHQWWLSQNISAMIVMNIPWWWLSTPLNPKPKTSIYIYIYPFLRSHLEAFRYPFLRSHLDTWSLEEYLGWSSLGVGVPWRPALGWGLEVSIHFFIKYVYMYVYYITHMSLWIIDVQDYLLCNFILYQKMDFAYCRHWELVNFMPTESRFRPPGAILATALTEQVAVLKSRIFSIGIRCCMQILNVVPSMRNF